MRLVGHSSGITSRKSNTIYNSRSNHPTGTHKFVGIDGEAINLPNGEHIYGMLSIGNDPKHTIIDKNGLRWEGILGHLYNYHIVFGDKYTAYVGFYLSYDFDRWIRTMPYDRAYKLLTPEGRESRRSKSPNMHSTFNPVQISGIFNRKEGQWEIKMLGKKQFQFRFRNCRCGTQKCEHPGGETWMYICDAGPFFQSSFLKAIDPSKWSKPIVSNAEYEFIKKNKIYRPNADEFTEEMAVYNRLENEILARLMNVLNKAFRGMGIGLPPSKWFGPGQAAQSWMKKEKVPTGKIIRENVPIDFTFAARDSYFGGWFEIMMHGIIPGESHEYDINSAYPYIISTLPCLLHGNYDRGNGNPTKDTGYILVYASVSSRSNKGIKAIGTMLHRETHSTILRPERTKGWYWLSEIQAAIRAKLILQCDIEQWISYEPCDCPYPMRNVAGLYDLRLKMDKDSPSGKAAKLAYNSMYGKLAQSIGDPIFANSVYASLITSGCRRMILDAIATHPKGAEDVCMVATDAVFFVTPHPTLPKSKRLGEWGYKCRYNLTLFKPGVYWDDDTRRDISANRIPSFKARGIAAKDFAGCIEEIDREFKEWDSVAPAISIADGILPGWPAKIFESGFTIVSCLQAIRRGKWETAGMVIQNQKLGQNSNPCLKRWGARPSTLEDGRIVWRSIPRQLEDDELDSMPYRKQFGMEDPWSDLFQEAYGIDPNGPIDIIIKEGIGL